MESILVCSIPRSGAATNSRSIVGFSIPMACLPLSNEFSRRMASRCASSSSLRFLSSLAICLTSSSDPGALGLSSGAGPGASTMDAGAGGGRNGTGTVSSLAPSPTMDSRCDFASKASASTTVHKTHVPSD